MLGQVHLFAVQSHLLAEERFLQAHV